MVRKISSRRQARGKGTFVKSSSQRGGMDPKVGADIRFVKSGGKRAIVASLKQMRAVLSGEA